MKSEIENRDPVTTEILDRLMNEPAPFMEVLHAIQDHHGYFPENSLRQVSERFEIPISELYGTVTFYHFFRLEPKPVPDIMICENSACYLHGLEAISEEAVTADFGIAHSGKVEKISCPGRCDVPVPILIGEKFFHGAKAGAVSEAVAADMPLPPETGLEECLFRHIRDGIGTLDGALAQGAWKSLAVAATDPDKVITELKESGLTGRGGAGFPTGVKWEAVRSETRGPKWIICNADESEVGCFKDRVLMAHSPHAMLEGMACAGLVTGAEVGIVYLRWEYPEILESLQVAIDEAEAAGLLGADACGTGRPFRIVIRRGAGAYICGEETSLLNSLEGKHPFPREKPPFPTTHGLFDLPTVVNNVETFCAVPTILEKGGAWFNDLGEGDNAGTRIFSVSGDITRPGNYEVPVGTSLRELLEKHAGGTPDGKAIQGVTMAGISGGFVGAADLDVCLDPASLDALGAMLGAGGIVVHDETRCMVQAARESMHFLAQESCGKCFPCRIGTIRVTEILDEMIHHSAGNPVMRDDPMQELADLEEVLGETSACGLGMAAPFITKTLKKYWPDVVQNYIAGHGIENIREKDSK
ncbi:MAG: NAD(P)H-dependent oxidoreductase subunit E [Planctomycetota bacterium]|nr:NAD(P)H-dependent oxidoreductase subunit E [Planctomycetota bacterium]